MTTLDVDWLLVGLRLVNGLAGALGSITFAFAQYAAKKAENMVDTEAEDKIVFDWSYLLHTSVSPAIVAFVAGLVVEAPNPLSTFAVGALGKGLMK